MGWGQTFCACSQYSVLGRRAAIEHPLVKRPRSRIQAVSLLGPVSLQECEVKIEPGHRNDILSRRGVGDEDDPKTFPLLFCLRSLITGIVFSLLFSDPLLTV